MREQFEKLPEIKEHLEYCRYSESKNKYISNWYNTMFINGAWYAYQEQQKVIDQVIQVFRRTLVIESNLNEQIRSLKAQNEILERIAGDRLR